MMLNKEDSIEQEEWDMILAINPNILTKEQLKELQDND